MHVIEVNTKTLFVKLKDVYQECFFLIEGEPKLYPLFCLVKDHCPRNANCMEHLARRIKYLFDAFSNAELLLLYFSYPDKPGSIRAGIFWRDFREPRVITFNRSAWKTILERDDTLWYEWEFPQEAFLPTSK